MAPAVKAVWKATGSIRPRPSLQVAGAGMPWGRSRQPRHPAAFSSAKSAIPTPSSTPLSTAQRTIIQKILELVELGPRLAARIGQVGKIRARVEQWGPSQVAPSDQSRSVILAIPLLSTPHLARLPCVAGVPAAATVGEFATIPFP